MVALNQFRNLGLACGDCKAEQKKTTQRLIKDHGVKPEDLIGQHVQLAFPIKGEGDQKENMWVLVFDLDDVEDLRGQLDNTPTLAAPWKCGDWLSFQMDEIILIYAE